jgi:biotin synthase-related radical SAM superfamily protein
MKKTKDNIVIHLHNVDTQQTIEFNLDMISGVARLFRNIEHTSDLEIARKYQADILDIAVQAIRNKLAIKGGNYDS